MSSTDIAIAVRGLSKSYTIEHNQERHSTLAEQLLHRARRGFRRVEKETFWALTDLSFDVRAGDVVGVIGRNGAGKSTLLKILSRITEPTRGEVDLYGAVGSLLEVGTGFHPELTGRENIFLNGAILGMSRREIARQFDAIVDFSGVEQFLDTPVKRYSSGMYVRLAFAVAAHLSSEILLVDEVLAVGDAEFQKKCLGKIKDVAHGGRTVLFVSHHMQSVQVLCTRAMYLEKGKLLCYGDVPQAIDYYVRSFERPAMQTGVPQRRPGTGELRITSVSTTREFYECAGEKTVRFTIERFAPFTGRYFLSCHIVDHYGVTILQCDSRMVGHWIDPTDHYEGEFTLRTPWLKPNTYRVDLFICSAGVIDAFEHACQFEILPLLPYPAAGNTEATSAGIVFADYAYDTIATESAIAASAAGSKEFSKT
jgi:lipopolysaccharide transport system ATP-binding protein